MSEMTAIWKKLRQEVGTFISVVDGKIEKLEAEEKRMEQKRDESYLKGAEDMREAMITIVSPDIQLGMRVEEVNNMFDTPYFSSILEQNSAINIIDKVNQWKEEKEKQEDLKPGDEVEVIKDCHLNRGTKYIILPNECQPKTEPKVYSIINPTNFNKTWAHADELKKTGVVHRSLTVYFRGEENEIDGTLPRKAEKDKNNKVLHVGDEVTTDDGLVGIIIDDDDDDSIDSIVWITYKVTPAARGLDSCWIKTAKCKKTGRHFDSIPFDYNPEKEEETNE